MRLSACLKKDSREYIFLNLCLFTLSRFILGALLGDLAAMVSEGVELRKAVYFCLFLGDSFFLTI